MMRNDKKVIGCAMPLFVIIISECYFMMMMKDNMKVLENNRKKKNPQKRYCYIFPFVLQSQLLILQTGQSPLTIITVSSAE